MESGSTATQSLEFDEKWEPGSWSTVAYAKNIAPEEPPSKCEGEERHFICCLCNRTYKRKNDARIHVGEAHLSLYKFFCWLCPHKTSRGWSFKRHLRNVHRVDIPQTRGIRKLNTGSVSNAYALSHLRRFNTVIAELQEEEGVNLYSSVEDN